jgi:hypothetical protein
MRIRSLFDGGFAAKLVKMASLAALVIVVAGACQGPPPTEYVIITATETPTAIVLVVTATPDSAQTTVTAQNAGQNAQQDASLTAEAVGVTATPTTDAEVTPTQQATRRRGPTPTLDPFPTPTISEIQVAEQLFENGRMFWLQPTNQIWVMVETGDGSGVWTVYEDLFVEGDVEFDPQIVAPTGLLQPERGFGRLWRETEDVQDAIGWALEPEIGYVSHYEYRPAGEVMDGVYIQAPGYHILSSNYGEVFRFNEINGTWQRLEEAEEE